MTKTATIAPVIKSVHVSCSVARAFEVFTREIGSWWPLDRIAVHPGEVREMTWEEREGGEVYETSTAGEKAHWATVVAWNPPDGFVLEWQVDPDAAAPTELEVRFVPDGSGARVELEHRHWERLGADGGETRANYDGGWDMVLGGLEARLA